MSVYLHEEDVLVAVVAQHVVVDLCHDAVPVLAVDVPDVGSVDFVLVLYKREFQLVRSLQLLY